VHGTLIPSINFSLKNSKATEISENAEIAKVKYGAEKGTGFSAF